MRVLVTGAAGLLGAAIVREFSPHAELVTLDRAALDLTDSDAVAATIAAAAPTVVINCAAYNAVDAAETHAVEALQVNAFAVLALARAARAADAVFVQYSTDFVFDGAADRPYTEVDVASPRSVYGASKLLGDWFALEESKAYVLRVASLFGTPSPAGGRRGSVGTIVDQLTSGIEVPVFTDRTVSPTSTADIARATRRILSDGAAPGLYHCVSSGSATWAEIAEETAAILGLPLRARSMTLASASFPAPRPRYSALSNEKLKAAGVPMPAWQEALRRFLLPGDEPSGSG